MREALQRAWLRRGPLACVLWPLSLLFALLASLRRAAYRAGLAKTTRVAVPVVIVGNVVVGGSGKTPVVMAIVQHLQSRGLAVGVVSRGYGRSSTGCHEVHPTSDVGEGGDEPLLIAQACRVPVFVAERRVDAAQALLKAYPATQVVVADDGLQHYALERDIEICVFDERGTGNGWLLPAGPLREAWPRRVDLLLRHRSAEGLRGHVMDRQPGEIASRADGTQIALTQLSKAPVTALAAIARAPQFFEMLLAYGLQLDRAIALPDHAGFDEVAPALAQQATLVCTQKDAAKLWRLRPDAWAVPLDLHIQESFWREFDRLLDAKLSSAHGSETPRTAGLPGDQGSPGL